MDELMKQWWSAYELDNGPQMKKIARSIMEEFLVYQHRYEIDDSVLMFIAQDWFEKSRTPGRPGGVNKTHRKLRTSAIDYAIWVKTGLIEDHRHLQTLSVAYGEEPETIAKWIQRHKFWKIPTPHKFRTKDPAGFITRKMQIAGEAWKNRSPNKK